MKIPVHSGNTSLAYVTDEERKLLRRRDAVKGSPNKKMTHGIPRLEGGGDYEMDKIRIKELRAKEDALRKAVKPLLEGGSKLPPLELNKDSTGLNASGYTFVGKDPQTQSEFNVDTTDGQQNYTTVELLKEDIEDLL